MSNNKQIESVTPELWKKYFNGDADGYERESIIEVFKNDPDTYISSLIELSKKFLSLVFNENITKKPFSDILKLSIKFIEDKEYSDELSERFPKTENEFYLFIADYYLHLNREPAAVIMQLYFEASEDLKIIEDNITKIKFKIDEINNFKGRGEEYLHGKYSYEIYKLEFYKQKNNDAKENILNFLANKIKSYAYNQCLEYNRLISPLLRSAPYSFSRRNIFFPNRNRASYDPDSFSQIESKFLELPIREFDQLNFDSTNKKISNNDFIDFSVKYISDKLLINNLKLSITKNHILNKRKNELEQIIFHYENQDYISVYHMTPPQIEGLFHDICIEVGIPESEIHKASISAILEKLRGESNIILLYEYYAFHFPVIRNRVAHGEILQSDYKYNALMVLLDLFPVCKMALSDDLKINFSLNLIKSIIETQSYESLYSWIDYLDYKHPDFYKLEEKIIYIKGMFESDDFWNFMSKKIVSIDLNEARKKIAKLKYHDLAIDKCVKCLKEIHLLEKELKMLKIY